MTRTGITPPGFGQRLQKRAARIGSRRSEAQAKRLASAFGEEAAELGIEVERTGNAVRLTARRLFDRLVDDARLRHWKGWLR